MGCRFLLSHLDRRSSEFVDYLHTQLADVVGLCVKSLYTELLQSACLLPLQTRLPLN